MSLVPLLVAFPFHFSAAADMGGTAASDGRVAMHVGGHAGQRPPRHLSEASQTEVAKCYDTSYWSGAFDTLGASCEWYTDAPTDCGGYDDDDFSSEVMCCECGGGVWQACSDADNGAGDVDGITCEEYASDPLRCAPKLNGAGDLKGTVGAYDDDDFTTGVSATCSL